MPWHVAKSASCPDTKPWAVIKDSDGSIAGCHATKMDAEKQQAALYAQEDKSMSRPDRPPKDNLIRAVWPGPELRSTVDGAMPTLHGHFAVFDQWTEIDSVFEGRFMEQLAPGSFTKTIKENRDNIRVLFQHGRDPQVGDKPLGPIETLEEDAEGAFYEVPLLDTTYNRDLRPGLEAGLYGASFRFRVVKEDLDQKPSPSKTNPEGLPERTIREVELMEFGPVTFPAYAGASAGVRSLTDAYIFERFTEDPGKFRDLLALRDGAGESHSTTEAASVAIEPVQVLVGERGPELFVTNTTTNLATATITIDTKETQPVSDHAADPLEEFRTSAEMQAAIADRRTQLQSIDAENEGRVLEPVVQAQWDLLNQQVDDLMARMAATEARKARLSNLGSTQAAESGEARYAPQVVRKVENIWDLSEVRGKSEAEERQQLRDRALKAVEVSRFPHPTAKRSEVQEHVASLVDHVIDTDDDGRVQFDPKAVARRILQTGSPEYHRAFGKYISTGLLSAPIERAFSLGTTGIPIPYQLDPTIIPTGNSSVSPYRRISRVIPITVDEWRGATSGAITAAYAAEATETTDNTPTLTQPTISTEKAQAFIPFSIEAGMDWPSLESEMAALLQDAKDDLEATKFTLGTGTNEPFGLIVGATTLVTGGGGAGTFVIGDLYKTEEALPPRHRPRAQWVGNRFVYNKARQFDTAGGAGLWMYLPAGLNNDVPTGGNTGGMLLGYPANEVSAMDAVLTTGSEILVLGDFSRFIIIDRIGLNVEFIPHLVSTNHRPTGQRGLYAYWRNGSKVVDANAFRTLQTA